jgi:prophage tail gpP-like protein
MGFDLRNSVQLILGGDEVFIVESYQVRIGMLAQPAAFAVQLGNNQVAKALMKKYPPNTKFELRINEAPQFVGRTDGWTVTGSGDGPTTLQLRGRDSLALLHDACVESDLSFSDVTFTSLTSTVLDKVYGDGQTILLGINDANRKVMTGSTPKVTKPIAAVSDDVLTEPNAQQKTLQAKIGQRWYGEFLKPQYDRGGLFLTASCNEPNSFILSTPNANQNPLYRIRHRRGAEDNVVKSVMFKNEPTARFAQCVVHGRRGGGAEARSKILGTYVDQEMVALGYKKSLVVKDDKCTTTKQAEFLARRKIAESRRAAWQLQYTVSGHTTPSLVKGTAVWAPDTIVEVDDEDLGVSGLYYVESVEHRGAPQTETTLTLMRPGDVIFGEAA